MISGSDLSPEEYQDELARSICWVQLYSSLALVPGYLMNMALLMSGLTPDDEPVYGRKYHFPMPPTGTVSIRIFGVPDEAHDEIKEVVRRAFEGDDFSGGLLPVADVTIKLVVDDEEPATINYHEITIHVDGDRIDEAASETQMAAQLDTAEYIQSRSDNP